VIVTDEDAVMDSAEKPRTGRGDRLAMMLLVPLLVVLIVVVAVFYVFFSALQVDGPSMLPTLRNQDRLLLTHGYPTPARGDVIALNTVIHGQPDDIIKRVVAIPGDTIEIRADVAYVNGVREPDYGQIIVHDASVNASEQVVPEGTLYVLGDNRVLSEDSRFIGPIQLSGVFGRAVAVFSPVTRVRLVH
jgi:signal peptidase I